MRLTIFKIIFRINGNNNFEMKNTCFCIEKKNAFWTIQKPFVGQIRRTDYQKRCFNFFFCQIYY